jgi:hypothetical protein
LTFELHYAHVVTTRLAEDEVSDAEGQNHLAYLRDLQRVRRQALAHALVDGERMRAGER